MDARCILIFTLFALTSCVKDKMMPHGMSHKERMTCEEFGKFARFSPYSVTDATFKVFYYWARSYEPMDFNFTVPTKATLELFKSVLNPHVKTPIDWNNVKIYLKAPIPTLLVETGNRGQHDMYEMARNFPKDHVALPIKVIFKQVGKYIGMMVCESKQTYALARKKDMPRRDEAQEAASQIGFRGRGGRSYLYQGNDWMPIGDAHEEAKYGPGMKYL